MSIPITGDNDGGPASCVGRFIRASTAGDEAGAFAELHPDSQSIAKGIMSPPPMESVELAEPIPAEDGVLIAALLHHNGAEQRFVFAVRPVENGWGIDLNASMEATFGGDPAALLGEAMQQALQPLTQTMDAVANAFGEAFGGTPASSAPVRRLAQDDSLGSAPIELDQVACEVVRLTWQRSCERAIGSDEPTTSTELSVRCGFAVPSGWIVTACRGVQVEEAISLEGDSLVASEQDPSQGSESYASWERESGQYNVSFPLAAPSGTFSGLAALRGTLSLNVEGGDVIEILVGPLHQLFGTTTPIAALNMHLAIDRDGDGRVQVVGPYDCFEAFAEFDFIDTAGDPISTGYSGHGDGETSTRSYEGDLGDDAMIRLRFRSQAGDVTVPFNAGGLPLRLV